ncbi:tyrosine-type recombinase/integrase [Saccharothrix variisporea]|uniref:Site-specific recombinase XerD n=1 Tax=Saccharothrix variisporea TaxID=543527 RepID=A0A495X6F6_9PSEU|nr:tyrosine-type recombinase/integrase [Saccharothrix variisporea]RKT67078.1 site-specific recombinase XerD [Saccharothrix variisporea]
MGFTKDLWTTPEKPASIVAERTAEAGEKCRCGKPAVKVCTVKGGVEVAWCGENKRIPNARHGKGKRWLAVWHDPDGNEKTKAFAKKTPADLHWQAQETDVERGEYHDPKAGKETFDSYYPKWRKSRKRDPATLAKYDSVYRLHVKPVFGHRSVKGIKASQVSAFQTELGERFGPSTVATARLVMVGVLELATADEAIKKNPAKSPIVQRVQADPGERKIQAWADDVVFAVIDGHPDYLRAMPTLSASCGLREGEAFGFALEDINFSAEVVHIRRQIKKLGPNYVFALPKNDRERTVPLSPGGAQALREHIRKYPPQPLTLPWEKVDGAPVTHQILFRWFDGGHVTSRAYSESAWKPALAKAKVIPQPEKDSRGRKRYKTTRREGTHQLRHYFASVMLADGVNIAELAVMMGHHDPAYTLKIYVHMLPDSHARARSAMNARMFRPRAVG